MKNIRFPSKLLLIAFVAFGLITFFFDVLRYSSSLTFSQWEYLDELINLVNIVIFYFYIKQFSFLNTTDIHKNLRNFIKILAGLYVWVFLWQQLLSPSFSATDFPKLPETVSSLFFSNLISMAGVVFLVPLLIIIKNLIFYKQKERSLLYLIIALISSGVAIVITIVMRVPLDINFSPGNYLVSGTLVLTLIFFVMLSTHNNWITYLSRKEKFSYFAFSFIMVWVVAFLFDFAFRDAVASHSVGLAAFTNLSWYFLFFYTIFTCIAFLFHLPTARVFDRKMMEVRSLHQLSRVISAEFDQEKLIKIITRMTTDVIESNYTWIQLYDSNRDRLYTAAANNMETTELEAIGEPVLHDISEQIVRTKTAFSVNNLSKNKEYQALRKWKKDIGSLAAAPLLSSTEQVLGIIFATKLHEYGFDPDDTNMLEAYANQAAAALENARLIKKSLEQERMERELQIARDVQLRLLPQRVPTPAGYDIDTLTITAYEVGGDYYDFYSNGKDGLGVIIGDVSGKGTSAAFYMAETKGIIQSITRNHTTPFDILVNTNRILFDSLDRASFITLIAAYLDYEKRELTFARAGHCPVLHYRSKTKSTHIYQPSGIAVGMDRKKVFESTLKEQKVSLEKDDIVALFTDGLSEAMNHDDDEFGEERLCDVIKHNAGCSAEQLKELVIDEILKFVEGRNLHDDLTLILIKC